MSISYERKWFWIQILLIPFFIGEKILACGQNFDLQAANSEELCVILKRKNQGCTRIIFLGFYLQHCELQMGFGNHRYKTSESDILDSTSRSDRKGDVQIGLGPSGFPLFPPGSFKLLFLLSATRSYGNLLH